MATFHCYCALCSCSLGSYELGSKKPGALRRRRARIARRIYWRSKEYSRYYETEDEEEEEKEERLRSMPAADSGIAQEDEDGESDCDSESERASYDPELLGPASLDWLHVAGGLGFYDPAPDPVPDGPRYILEDLDYYDCNEASMLYRDDPDTTPESFRAYCYYSPAGGIFVFPFHWSCFRLLCRVILGHFNYDVLDKNALYDAMSQGKKYDSLDLPYGDITGNDQDWQSIPGEEYSVTSPSSASALDRHKVERFCNATEDRAKSSLDLSSKVQNDPFKLLPQEISDMILDYLPGESLIPLLGASWTIHARTRHPGFWKRRLYREMRWIWELRELLEWREDSKIHYKGLYIYLDEVTRPRYGMRTWLALANRRRIWGACEVLAERYHRVKQGNIAERID